MMMRRTLALVGVMALSTVGCDAFGKVNIGPEARIIVVNGTTGPVRVRVDGEVLASSVAPGEFSPFIQLRNGASTVVVQPATGSTLTGAGSVALPTDGTGSGRGVAFVTATVSESGEIMAQLLPDTASRPEAGASKLQVVHLAPAAGEIDIWRVQPDFAEPVRFMFPFDYGDESSFVQSETTGLWTVYVTPRSTPGPGEPDPRPSAIAQQSYIIGNEAKMVLVLDAAGGGVTIVEAPVEP